MGDSTNDTALLSEALEERHIESTYRANLVDIGANKGKKTNAEKYVEAHPLSTGFRGSQRKDPEETAHIVLK